MRDITKRLARLEEDILGKNADQYRKICFSYNLTSASDEDLIEYSKSILENRECNPEVIKRLYASIPTDAPSHLVSKARVMCNCQDIPDLDLEHIYKEILIWENWRKKQHAKE
jgi:hypothetical protein